MAYGHKAQYFMKNRGQQKCLDKALPISMETLKTFIFIEHLSIADSMDLVDVRWFRKRNGHVLSNEGKLFQWNYCPIKSWLSWIQFAGSKAKRQIWNRVFQKNKACQIFRKTNISYPLYISGDKTCLFFGKFDVLCFLETPVLRFALLPYYRRTEVGFLHGALYLLFRGS